MLLHQTSAVSHTKAGTRSDSILVVPLLWILCMFPCFTDIWISPRVRHTVASTASLHLPSTNKTHLRSVLLESVASARVVTAEKHCHGPLGMGQFFLVMQKGLAMHICTKPHSSPRAEHAAFVPIPFSSEPAELACKANLIHTLPAGSFLSNAFPT